MKKAELISILQDGRDRLISICQSKGPEHMQSPGVSGIYSAKDVLAHVSAYERGLVIWLQEARAGRVYVDPLLDHPDLDYRNARIYLANQDRDPQEVLEDFRRTALELEACVSELGEEELNDPALTAWFVVPRWGQEQALWECIVNDSAEHRGQHLPDLERWSRLP